MLNENRCFSSRLIIKQLGQVNLIHSVEWKEDALLKYIHSTFSDVIQSAWSDTSAQMGNLANPDKTIYFHLPVLLRLSHMFITANSLSSCVEYSLFTLQL